MLRKLLLMTILFGAMVFQGFAFGPADSCLKFSTKMSDGTTMYFRLYVPRHYSTQYKYPFVLQMHGIGECGTDDSVQVNREYMSHQWMLDSVKSKYQPFVLYPQCPSSSFEFGYFNTGTAAQKGYAALPAVAAVRILDSLIKVYPIDTTRLYVGGLSWGGIGTQGIMMSYPNKFAAAFPCAGENYRDSLPIMTKTPFWLWHGLADGTVPCKPDTQLVAAVIKAGIPVVKFVTGWTLSTLKFTPQGISVDSLNRAITGGSNYLATWIPAAITIAVGKHVSIARPLFRGSCRSHALTGNRYLPGLRRDQLVPLLSMGQQSRSSRGITSLQEAASFAGRALPLFPLILQYSPHGDQ